MILRLRHSFKSTSNNKKVAGISHFSNVNQKGLYMADSKFTKGQERAFYKLKRAMKKLDDVVYVTPPKKK